ncbi:hypothetical protein FRC08_009338 [Ceratobasidium sp. 394]|nr:hypothetical protein FRC08_009338 [Ceratobasidium sp. 394]
MPSCHENIICAATPNITVQLPSIKTWITATEEFFPPASPVLHTDHISAIHYLLGTVNDPPTPQQCNQLASYLETIHTEFKAFHNGGIEMPRPDLSVLERAPTIPEDINFIPPSLGQGPGTYQLQYTMAGALNHATFMVHNQLVHLNHVLFSRHLTRSDSVYQPFHRCNMMYVEEPEQLQNRLAFNQVYVTLSELENLVSDTQLWLAFTPMFCSLMACAQGVFPMTVRHFRPEMFWRNRVALLAHNWYMSQKGAPKEYIVFGL